MTIRNISSLSPPSSGGHNLRGFVCAHLAADNFLVNYDVFYEVNHSFSHMRLDADTLW